MSLPDIRNTISQNSKLQFVIPALLLLCIFFWFYKNSIIANPIITGDLIVPYPLPPFVQLSYSTPWYNLFSTFFYLKFYFLYGYVFNTLQIFLFVPAYFSMYLLLSQLKVRKFYAIFLSAFYLINPVVFPLVFTYTNLMWSEFYLFAPLLLLFLLKYKLYGDTKYLIVFSTLLSIYIEI